MNLNKLATWGLWDEAGSGMNDLECYSSKYAQIRKADVIQQTKRTVLYFIWEGFQTLAQSFWKVDQFCALGTQGMCTLWIGLALAWPRSMMGLGISVLVVPWPRKLCLLLVLNVPSTCEELRPGDCVLALNKLPCVQVLHFLQLLWADQLFSQEHIRTLKCRHGASRHHNNPLMHNKSVMQVHRSVHPSQNTCQVA